MNLEFSQNFMITMLICFRKSLWNRFRQEGLPLSGIKSFHLFSLIWFVKHIFSYIFNALTSLLQENANFFCIFKDERKAFPELQKIFRKMFHWKLEEVEFPLCMSWHFATTKKPFRNQLCHFMITYPFSFQAYPSSMSKSTFHCLIHHNFPHVYLSKSHTFFLIFQFIFLFMNKTIQLPFHDYIDLLSLP